MSLLIILGGGGTVPVETPEDSRVTRLQVNVHPFVPWVFTDNGLGNNHFTSNRELNPQSGIVITELPDQRWAKYNDKGLQESATTYTATTAPVSVNPLAGVPGNEGDFSTPPLVGFDRGF